MREDGKVVTTYTDRDGNHVVVERTGDGTVLNAKAYRREPVEPGREYYETEYGGTDWETLPPEVRSRMAAVERWSRERAEAQRIRELQTEANSIRERLEAARKAADSERRETAARELQAQITRERLALEQREGEIRRREARQEALQNSSEKAAELERQHAAAYQLGDMAEVQPHQGIAGRPPHRKHGVVSIHRRGRAGEGAAGGGSAGARSPGGGLRADRGRGRLGLRRGGGPGVGAGAGTFDWLSTGAQFQTAAGQAKRWAEHTSAFSPNTASRS